LKKIQRFFYTSFGNSYHRLLRRKPFIVPYSNNLS
jgi:hypothetical protein